MSEDATGGSTHRDVDDARAILRRLAGADAEATVERAVAAVDDLELAVEFLEAGGLDELEAAVGETDDEALAARGQRALAAFRRFRAAAAGELDGAAVDGRDPGHFHRGRGTDLRRDGEATST